MLERLDQPQSLDELTKALESFEKNKTPGTDGLPARLYSVLWDLTGRGLLEVYDIMHLAVTHLTQICAILGREIAESVSFLRDTIAYMQYKGVDTCLISLGQEKAFNRISHMYVRDILSKMGFGQEPFAESIWKDASLRGVTIPGSGGLQFKASLHMDDVTVFCLDALPVRRLMNICDQFELVLGTKDRLPEGAGRLVRRVRDMHKNLEGACHQSEAELRQIETLIPLH
eukprot:g23277.t1